MKKKLILWNGYLLQELQDVRVKLQVQDMLEVIAEELEVEVEAVIGIRYVYFQLYR